MQRPSPAGNPLADPVRPKSRHTPNVPSLPIPQSVSATRPRGRGSRSARSTASPTRSMSVPRFSARSYSPSSPSRSLAAIQARRQVMMDEQLLSNRVQRLKIEEQRARQKIGETRKRAEQIREYKRRNEEAQKERAKLHAEREAEASRGRADLLKRKEMQAEAVRRSREAAFKKRQRIRDQIKEEQKLNVESLKHNHSSRKERNLHLRRSVVQHERGLKEKRSLETEKMERAAREKYMKRIEEEEKKRQEKEENLEEMARAERELIEHLRNLQKEQRNAYQQLENALDEEYE